MLGDIDRWRFSFYITKPLLEKLKGIGFIANDYLVLYLEDNFNILERSSLEPWPEELADEEEKVQWVHILTSAFDFSAQTPEKRK